MSDLVISQTVVIPLKELEFTTSRSGGPGGQNVNKLETKVELRFNIQDSRSLSADEKLVLLERLQSRLDRNGLLRVVSQESRSQWENKQRVIERFVELVGNALKPRKKRKPTKPSKSSREQRLRKKRIRSDRKRTRRVSDE